MDKIAIYNERKVGSLWLLFLLLGWSYGSLDQMGKQVFYYLTLGGFGLWTIYVLFTLSDKVKKYNRKVAQEAGFTSDELMKFGLI